MMFQKVSIGAIPEKKLKNALKKGLMTLSKADLEGSGYTMRIHPESYNKVKAAMKRGSGTRLLITPPEIIESLKDDNVITSSGELDDMAGGSLQGGSIWRSIWKALKDAWEPVIKPALSAGLDAGSMALGAYTGQPLAIQGMREGVRRLTGVGVKPVSKRMGKGTPEMKAHMAKLREMKKSKKLGSSFRLS